MPLQDLFTALKMFEQGATDLAVHRAISSATDQAAALKDQVVDEAQRTGAQRDLANALAAHLTGIGADPRQIATAVGAVSPPSYKFDRPEEVLLSSGAPESVRGEARRMIAEGREHDLAKAKISHESNPMTGALRQAQFAEKVQKDREEAFRNYAKDQSPHMQVRSAAGQTAGAKMQAERLLAAVGGIHDAKSPEYQEVTKQILLETSATAARLATGGVPAQSMMHDWMPSNAKSKFKTVEEWFSSQPTAQELGAYVANFTKFARREAVLAQGQAEKMALSTAKKRFDLAERDENQFKVSTAEALGTTPDRVIVDRDKKGKAVGVRWLDEEELQKTIEAEVRDAKALMLKMQSTDGATRAKAERALRKFGYEPGMSYKELKYVAEFNHRFRGGK